jgi:CRISPR-associated protein Csy1
MLDTAPKGKDMNELTDRGKVFRAAIANFVGNKLKKAPRGADGSYTPADTTECQNWLLNAVGNIGNASIATHPIRLTHSSIKGATSIYVQPDPSLQRQEIGTHSVPRESNIDFAIGNSPQVPVCQLLQHRGPDGKSLASWLAAGDPDLIAALAASTGGDASTATTLANALNPATRAISHGLAKQVYWLAGDEPQHDHQYHLLQPMASSTLEDVLYDPISNATDAYFKARGTQKKAPTFAHHATYPGIVRRNIGGANPQNVSPLNSVRHGNNYLLASLPPPAWKPRDGANMLKVNSMFDDKRNPFFSYGEVRQHVRQLADFLKANPDRNKETRDQVGTLLQRIVQALPVFGAEVRGRYPAGWTRDEACRLPLCEQLWLDPDRTELPLRNDPENPHWLEDDLAFNAAYELGDWADEVAGRFGRWLNDQLRKRSDKLAPLGEPEMRHFASQAILDVAWPIPLQRRAKAGAA